METQALTTDMVLVMAVIGLAVLLFITEWVRVDVVGIIMMVVLPLLGLVRPERAFDGLASNAVVSILAVMVIGKGLDKTGLINRAVEPVVRAAGKSPNRLVMLLASLVAGISSFMQNIGAAALVLPAVQRISRQENIPVGKLLMPIGFACILGGTVTLVGSSPLILLNDLIAPLDLKPFSLFSVTPVGVLLVAAGIGYFLVLGRWVLPGAAPVDNHIGCVQHPLPGRHYELAVGESLPEPLTSKAMRSRYAVRLVGLKKAGHGEKLLAPDERCVLSPGDVVAVVGAQGDVDRLAEYFHLEARPSLEVFADDLSAQNWGQAEAVVGPQSELEGRTLGEAHFRHKFQLNVLNIFRGTRRYTVALDEMELRPGDSIQLEGRWENFRVLAEQGLLIFCSPVKEEPVPLDKARWAGIWLGVSLVMILILKMQLSLALMTGALGMILTRVLTIDEAYRSVDWRTIFLLAGLMPLGLATMHTGAAAWLAGHILALIGPTGPMTLLAVVGALATAFTLVVSNVGATVLLVPLAVQLAEQAGGDPRIAALVVALATSNSFILPTHQVNALYMGPGRYHASDFIKAGAGMTVLFLAVMLGGLWLFHGVR